MKELRQCVGCGNKKHRAQYYKSSGTEDGLNRYCKQCCKVNRALEAVRKRDKKSKMSFRQRHRAKLLKVECDDTITLAQIFRLSAGMCYLCDKWVKPGVASMDHVFPLGKGGTHTWDNIKLTHLKCNLRKGDRV